MARQDLGWPGGGRFGSSGMEWFRFWYIFQAVWNTLLYSADHQGGRVGGNASFPL